MEPVKRRGHEDDARPQDVPIDDRQSLQWGFFEYLPVTVQDVTGEVLMIQYMTEEGLERSLQEGSLWLWSRSRERYWMAGRDGGGYDLVALRANCMGDSLLAIVDAEDDSDATSATGAASRSHLARRLADTDSLGVELREQYRCRRSSPWIQGSDSHQFEYTSYPCERS